MASDDFDVMSVDVALSDGEGNPLESGVTVETLPDSGRWVYVATTSVATDATVRIAVTASDRPGSVDTAEEEKAV